MRFHYDKKADALYIRFNDQRYFESDEVSEGVIFDYDRHGKIVGMEILDASQKFPVQFRNEFKKSKLPVVLEMVQRAPQTVR